MKSIVRNIFQKQSWILFQGPGYFKRQYTHSELVQTPPPYTLDFRIYVGWDGGQINRDRSLTDVALTITHLLEKNLVTTYDGDWLIALR